MEPPLSAVREVETMKRKQQLMGCVTLLQDKQLLAKIGNGDVMAQFIKSPFLSRRCIQQREQP